jgi:hypothetical protein
MEDFADRAIASSPESIVGTETDQRVRLAGVVRPMLEYQLGVAHRPIIKLDGAGSAIFAKPRAITGDVIDLVQICWRTLCGDAGGFPGPSMILLPEKSFRPDQESVDFGFRYIAITTLGGVKEPAFSSSGMLREIDGQPFG